MAAAAAPVAGAIAGVSPDERARYVRWRGLVSLGSERLGKPRDVANPFVPITHAACGERVPLAPNLGTLARRLDWLAVWTYPLQRTARTLFRHRVRLIAFLLGGKRHPSLPHGDCGSGLPGDSV